MTTAHDRRFEELLPAHVLGALDEDERRELEAHLEGCPVCRDLLLSWQRELEELALAAPPVSPSEASRARLLARTERPERAGRDDAETAAAAVGPRRDLGWLAAAAALLLAVWAGWAQVGLRRQVRELEAERERIETRLAAVTSELEAARGDVTRLSAATRVIASPAMRPIVLAGLDAGAGASAHTFVNPSERKAVFYAYNLQPPPAGKTYQLWFIADGKPVSAGTFDVDPQGHGALLVENVAPVEQIQAWAVTVEPAGGVPQPTGAMVLKG
ncbi:MAG TPA: anti-sigma factor [Thermoanaerobaculia bacterium]|nr:anti-sigma factor [Thermoanaerobaculia bacterium]